MELSKQGLFATPNNWQEIEDFIMRMDPKSRAEAVIVAGLTWNLAVEIAKEMEKVKHVQS